MCYISVNDPYYLVKNVWVYSGTHQVRTYKGAEYVPQFIYVNFESAWTTSIFGFDIHRFWIKFCPPETKALDTYPERIENLSLFRQSVYLFAGSYNARKTSIQDVESLIVYTQLC